MSTPARENPVYEVVYSAPYDGRDHKEFSAAPVRQGQTSRYEVVFDGSADDIEKVVAPVLEQSQSTGDLSTELSSIKILPQVSPLKSPSSTPSVKSPGTPVGIATPPSSPREVKHNHTSSSIGAEEGAGLGELSLGEVVQQPATLYSRVHAHADPSHPVERVGPSSHKFYVNAGVVALGVAAGALVNNLGLEYEDLVSKIKNDGEGIFNLLLYNLLLKLFKGNYKHVNSYMQQLATLGTFSAFGMIAEAMTKGKAFGPTALVTSIISVSLLLKQPLYWVSGKKTFAGPLVEELYSPPQN